MDLFNGAMFFPESTDMATCDIYLFGKLHLAMKGKRFADLDAIQNASTAVLNALPKDDLKKSFDNLLDRANRCIQCEGDYIKCLQKKTNFLFFPRTYPNRYFWGYATCH